MVGCVPSIVLSNPSLSTFTQIDKYLQGTENPLGSWYLVEALSLAWLFIYLVLDETCLILPEI